MKRSGSTPLILLILAGYLSVVVLVRSPALSQANSPPVLVTNVSLVSPPGQSPYLPPNPALVRTITRSNLEVADSDNTPDEITYSIVSPPANGVLRKSGQILGWVYNPATGHYYRETLPTYWHTANSEAATLGGYLAAIGGAAENAWLRQTFEYRMPGPGCTIGQRWMGFTDEGSEGNWSWTNGEPVTFTNWSAGEPNGGGTENYGHFYGNTGLWNDLAASAGPHTGFVESSTGSVLSSFTQDDIDNNRITYEHHGCPTATDCFTFTVSDGAGGSIGDTVFCITISDVTATPTLTPTAVPTSTPSNTPAPNATCGNGAVESVEQCDDGNTTSGDGCDETCNRERAGCCNNPSVTCNSDAACPGADTCCLTHCDTASNPPSCDGLGPACDDNSQCGPGGMCCGPVCDNGFVEPGEECDEGTNNGASACACSAGCTNAGLCSNNPSTCCVTDAECGGGTCCGNGIPTAPEECDDANRIDDDACSNQCVIKDGVPSCPGFVGADVVQATVKRTKFTDIEIDQLLERWKTKGSFILSGSQAKRFDPERQNVQVQFAERGLMGVRFDLWPASPLVQPDDCTPNLFCFPRKGLPTRFTWKKVKDQAEMFSPGLRKGRFKQRDNEIKFLFDGHTATITAPTDPLAPDLFLVRQDLVVGNLCATVQLECARRSSGRKYKCVATLLSP